MKSLLAPGVYAVAEFVPEPNMRKYITAGRHYLVKSDCDDALFAITADDGKPIACRWDRCAILKGQSWRRVVIESTHGNATGRPKGKELHIRIHAEAKEKAVSQSKALGVSLTKYIEHLIEQD